MNNDFSRYIRTLAELDLLPATELATLVVGSTARGWAHSTSDIDLVIVSKERFSNDRMLRIQVPLEPNFLPVFPFSRDGRAWEVKLWTDSQVDQLFSKVTWERFDAGDTDGGPLVTVEKLFLSRLRHCVPLSGEEWVERRLQQLETSAFRSFIIAQALAESDKGVEAAVGQLAANNIEDAVLLARTAFDYAMEALVMSHGEYEAGPKWRARRFKAAAPEHLSFEDYWLIQSMRTYDASAPEVWIEHVIHVCKNVAMEIDL